MLLMALRGLRVLITMYCYKFIKLKNTIISFKITFKIRSMVRMVKVPVQVLSLHSCNHALTTVQFTPDYVDSNYVTNATPILGSIQCT
jgi:hypothetical protein